MKFLYLAGFPRSGTTYVDRWVKSSLRCAGAENEQGLDAIWRCMNIVLEAHEDAITADLWGLFPPDDEIDEEQDRRLLRIKETHWMGVFVRKNFNTLGPRFLDGWCETVLQRYPFFARWFRKYYCVKTPNFVMPDDWPEGYIRESRLFRDYRAVALIRHPEEVLASGRKKFPHWKTLDPNIFVADWIRFYSDVSNRGKKWCVVRHADLSTATEETLQCLAKWLGIACPPVQPWKMQTDGQKIERWLTDDQRERVEDILNGDGVLRPGS